MTTIHKYQKMEGKTMKKRRISVLMFKIFLFCMMIFILRVELNASTLIELTLKDLCDNSSDIVIVNVVSIRSYLKEGEKRIFTRIEMQILDNLKGELNVSEKIILKVCGGSINGITTFVVGAPTFNVGDRSILFLSKTVLIDGNRTFLVTGLSQGKFNIFTDSETKTDKVVRDQIDIPLRPEKNAVPLYITDKESLQLQDFLYHVKEYIK
jgi:hypothetical protein